MFLQNLIAEFTNYDFGLSVTVLQYLALVELDAKDSPTVATQPTVIRPTF